MEIGVAGVAYFVVHGVRYMSGKWELEALAWASSIPSTRRGCRLTEQPTRALQHVR